MGHRLACLACIGLVACGSRSRQVGADSDVDSDADTDGTDDLCGEEPSFEVGVGAPVPGDVDLLVVVDNSNSMREEQANVTANLSALLWPLIDPPDDDGDGVPDWLPAASVHIGVVSTDMGTAGYSVTTCDNAERGDDGVLQNLPSPGIAGCDATYPKFLTFDPGADPGGIAQDFDCISTLGTGGCGFTQPLAALEKATTVHSQDGAANHPFLRPDALLAAILVSDADDCSVLDPTIFSDDGSLGPLSLRCFENPAMLQPWEEFVPTLLALKPGQPERVSLSAIVGVPHDLVERSNADLLSADVMSTADLDAILADPRMQERIDDSPEGGGARLVPSCDVPGLGVASPPRRIVQAVREVDRAGNLGIVQSICQADWSDTTEAIARAIGRVVGLGCTPVPLDGVAGHLDCALTATLSDGGPCGPGSFEVGRQDGRTVCQYCQALDGSHFATDFRGTELGACADSAQSWTYSPAGCGGSGQVLLSPGTEPAPGVTLRMVCTREAVPEPDDC